MDEPAATPAMKKYFEELEHRLAVEMDIAGKARERGEDPHPYVEIPLANDLADRVENLIGVKGVAVRIRELGKTMNREETALRIGKEIAEGSVGTFNSREEAVDAAIRVSMAVITEGVVAAPIEGVVEVKIDKNSDGTEFLRIYYSGPIRSAGGTAQALSVLVGDYVRRVIGLDRFKPRKEVVERYAEEIRIYKSTASLQYSPTDDEIRLIVENCPVCVDGDGTEEAEVEGFRNLPEIPTNKVRGGMALVVAEGMILKAPKVLKHVKKLEFDGWEFLEKLIAGSKPAGKETDEGGPKVKPKDKYMHDLIAGRPLFSHPSRPGGFRLRYGRSRNTSFASAGINPAAMVLLGDFITNGTQIKVERPGKAAGMSAVDTIEGPSVRLTSGDFLRADCETVAAAVKEKAEYIVDVGEILFNYGDFLENNHLLMPSPYCFEWWLYDYEAVVNPESPSAPRTEEGDKKKILHAPPITPEEWELEHIPAEKALFLAAKGVPLHPDHTYLWHDLTLDDLEKLHRFVGENGSLIRYETPGLSPRETAERIAALQPFFFGRSGNILTESRPYPEYKKSEMRPLTEEEIRAEDRENEANRSGETEYDPDRDDEYDSDGIAGTGGGKRPASGRSKLSDVERIPPGIRQFDLTAYLEAGFAGHVCLSLPYDACVASGIKTLLENLLVYHRVRGNSLLIADPAPLLRCLGLLEKDKTTVDAGMPIKPAASFSDKIAPAGSVLDAVNILSGITVKARAPSRLGARMGRPEKSDKRKMSPAAQSLFPIGDFGGKTRNMVNAVDFRDSSDGTNAGNTLRAKEGGKTGTFDVRMGVRQCLRCGEETYKWRCGCGEFTTEKLSCRRCKLETREAKCPNCGRPTSSVRFVKLDFKPIYKNALERLNLRDTFTEIKGVKALMSKAQSPEPLEKGILRSLHGIYMFKDGTVRYDMSDIPLTHIRADEIGITAEDLKRLGYTHDIFGKELTSDHQVVCLFVQDIIVSYDCGDYLLRTTQYIDDLLVRYYGMEPYYNAKTVKDLVGLMVMGLAPHTSAGVLGRLIGFTEASVGYAHPYFHASKRRNCDGDEDCVMLLLDGLLNFSREYLPDKRGGQMDAPLVLTTRIDPSEVDKEAQNIDMGARYPYEFYMAAAEYKSPTELEKNIDLVSGRLGTPDQYENFLFTHDTTNIAIGPQYSSYKTLGSMTEKMEAQLELGRIIRAVDVAEVAEKVLNSHFLPDIMGNLRAFSKQSTRCLKCEAKFRRPPLSGTCPACGGKVVLTVHEGAVRKYVDVSKEVAEKYHVSEYTKERILILENDINTTFNNHKIRQAGLSEYM